MNTPQAPAEWWPADAPWMPAEMPMNVLQAAAEWWPVDAPRMPAEVPMNVLRAPAEWWPVDAPQMPAQEMPMNALRVPAEWRPVDAPRMPAEMPMNALRAPAENLPTNPPQAPAVGVPRRRGRPFGSKTQIRHPPKSEEQKAKERRKRQEKKAARDRQTAVDPGFIQPQPGPNAMGDFDAMQISGASSSSRSGSSGAAVVENVAGVQILEATAASRSPPAAPVMMENADLPNISDESLAGLLSADLEDMVATTERTLDDADYAHPGYHNVTPAEMAGWAHNDWEAEMEQNLAPAAEEQRERGLERQYPRETTGTYQPFKARGTCETHYHPHSCNIYQCGNIIIMHGGDGTIDPRVLAKHP